MASFTKPKLLRCLLSVLLILSQTSMISKADEKLIKQECHNANVPTTCLQCLNSDPTSLKADRVGIAKIIIHCLNSHLNTLHKNVSNLIPTVKDKSAKTALQQCGKDLSHSAKYLSDADNGLNTANYDIAGHSVRIALDDPFSCEANLQTLKFEETIEEALEYVYYQIRVFGELSDAAMRIIDRF